MTIARSVRLFRPNLKDFTAHLKAVCDFSSQSGDESWVWFNDEYVAKPAASADAKVGTLAIPMVFQSAPEGVKASGAAYARWCILTSALTFQLADPESFVKNLSAWWGSQSHPSLPLPDTDTLWSALFDKDDAWFSARKAIFTEITTSKWFQATGQMWEAKIAMGRGFNNEDMTRLANLFPKAFADPFLFKAQRAVWQFTQAYNAQGQKVAVDLPGVSDVGMILDFIVSGKVKCHEVLEMKLKEGGLIRDEIAEKAVRAFLLTNSKDLFDENLKEGLFELKKSNVFHKTTDY